MHVGALFAAGSGPSRRPAAPPGRGRAVAGAEDPKSERVPNLWGLHGLEMSPLSGTG